MRQGTFLDLHGPRNGPCNAYFRGPWPNFNGPKNFWAKDNLTKNFLVDLFTSTLMDLWWNTAQKGLENGVDSGVGPTCSPCVHSSVLCCPRKGPCLDWSRVRGEPQSDGILYHIHHHQYHNHSLIWVMCKYQMKQGVSSYSTWLIYL